MRRNSGGSGTDIDPASWLDAPTTIEVPHRRWPHVVFVAVAGILLAVGFIYGSLMTRVLAGIGALALAPAVVLATRRTPHVIVSDTGISVAGPWASAVNPDQAVSWTGVVAVHPDWSGADAWGEQTGPSWFARRFDTVVMIERGARPPLAIKGILSGTTVEELHVAILDRWHRFGLPQADEETGSSATG